MKYYKNIIVSLMFFLMIIALMYDTMSNVKGGDGLAGMAYLGAAVVCLVLVVVSIIIYAIVTLIAFYKASRPLFKQIKAGLIAYLLMWSLTALVMCIFFWFIPAIRDHKESKKRIEMENKMRKEGMLTLLNATPGITYKWKDSSRTCLVKTDNGIRFFVALPIDGSLYILEDLPDSTDVDSTFMANRMLFYSRLFGNAKALDSVEAAFSRNDVFYRTDTVVEGFHRGDEMGVPDNTRILSGYFDVRQKPFCLNVELKQEYVRKNKPE